MPFNALHKSPQLVSQSVKYKFKTNKHKEQKNDGITIRELKISGHCYSSGC